MGRLRLTRRPRQERRTLTYKTVGPCAIQADLHRPAANGTLPLVFWIHGGLIGGSRRDILPRHRSGYLALQIAGAVLPPPCAVVTFSGYGDILGDWYTQPSPHHLRRPRVPERVARKGLGQREVSEDPGEERWPFYVYCRQRGIWPREVSGLDPVTDREALEAYCPVQQVGRSFPPALLVHGDADKDVPHQQSAEMVQALQAAGVDAALITVPRCGHMFEQVGTAQAEEAFADVLEFLRARLEPA